MYKRQGIWLIPRFGVLGFSLFAFNCGEITLEPPVVITFPSLICAVMAVLPFLVVVPDMEDDIICFAKLSLK